MVKKCRYCDKDGFVDIIGRCFDKCPNHMKGKYAPMYGKKHNQETKKKISKIHKGKTSHWKGKKKPITWGKEHSKKISGKKNPMFGKKHSEATKELIRKKALGRQSYWKGKTKHNNKYLKKVSKKLIGKSMNSLYGEYKSKEIRKKQSLSAVKRIRRNSINIFNGKYSYKNIKMRSNWEVKVAKWLDANNIIWEYESKKCVMSFNNFSYLVDFYLPELDKFIEVKGWWSDKSIEKYKKLASQFDTCIVDERNINNISLELVYLR